MRVRKNMSSDQVSPQIQKKVLVVEDERIIAINICTTLKQFGYDTEYLSEGSAVIEKIAEKEFDLILMDIMLGGSIDGIELARIIRKKKDIPVIFLTAYSDEATLDRAKSTEPAGYLIKPFNTRDLYVSVEMAIYKSQIQRQLKEVQQKLNDSQKWETIGLVASGISHEINNPLTSIMNFSDLIAREANKNNNHQLHGYAQKILNEAERIAKIIKNLVNYSQATSNQSSLVDVYMLLADTRSFLHQYFLKEGIDCNLEADEFPVIYCQPQKLKQAMLNLLQDARSRLLNDPQLENRKILAEVQIIQKTNEKDTILISIHDTSKSPSNFKSIGNGSIEITKAIISELGGKMKRLEHENGGSWEITLPKNEPQNLTS